MKRKALICGFNNTAGCAALSCCQNDATIIDRLLSNNYDGTKNFDTQRITDVNYVDKKKFVQYFKELLKSNDNVEISLFYFSGHGYSENNKTGIVLADGSRISSDEIATIVHDSNVPNKVLIFDSCHSGGILDMSSFAVMNKGVTLITACKNDEVAIAGKKHSVFTSLLIRSLIGEAADIRGIITASSIYAYIDMALDDAWSTQRPIFKTHVSEFAYIRKSRPYVEAALLKDIPNLFEDINALFHLDPSYEPVRNNKEEEKEYGLPKEEHVEIFKKLQLLERVGLVEPINLPIDKNNMYWAAMYSKSCRLTDIGKGYWYRAKINSIR